MHDLCGFFNSRILKQIKIALHDLAFLFLLARVKPGGTISNCF